MFDEIPEWKFDMYFVGRIFTLLFYDYVHLKNSH